VGLWSRKHPGENGECKTDAEKAANSIIEMGGAEAAGHGILGKVLLAEGKLPQAIDELKQAASASSGPSEARRLLVQAYVGANKASDAIDLLQKAIARDPKEADALVLLADVQFASEQADEAEKIILRRMQDAANSKGK